MPLFLFISGFFAYSASYDWGLLKKRSLNRLIKQFYPTMILWLIFCWIFREGDLNDWLLDSSKGGYWFTFVSVEMFFTVAPFLLLLSKYRSSPWMSSICLLLLCAIIKFIFYIYRDVF